MAPKKSSVQGLWSYMKERHRIYLRRQDGQPWPWTKDQILREGKFTNVLREYDRTTRAFNTIYAQHYKTSPGWLLLYNCAVARWFGTAEFYQSIGWQSTYDPTSLTKAARARMEAGKPVFTRAYVITNGGQSRPKEDYVANVVLRSLWDKVKEVTHAIDVHGRWRLGYEVIRECEGFGGTGFMAKEVLLDYIWHVPALLDKEDWTPVGPGALRGLGRIRAQDPDAKVHPRLHLQEVRALWEDLRGKWAAEFPYERSLSCHDVQFALCEYSKYERVRLGEGRMKNTYNHEGK